MDPNSLSTELSLEIVSHVPVLDYYNLKQDGCPRITAAVRQVCASLRHGTYLSEFVLGDQRRGGGPDAPRRRAMEVMVARGQCALAVYYERKYYGPIGVDVVQHGRQDDAEFKRSVTNWQVEKSPGLDEEKRSFRLTKRCRVPGGWDPPLRRKARPGTASFCGLGRPG
ncbi:hypothetical protein BJY01DRAFT_251992 [Aspergillus pseudoustus]|uniref:F-box domain-containing protein n=1 Tax=Aspergillus pseudoustus TaxID=1810923 RepID=A0ABR4J8Q7_9EURO